MKKALSFFILVVGLAALSCEPNEISFFVKHVKAMPTPPACSYSVSDESSPGIVVDLSLRTGVTNAFLLKNALLAREDYDNLRAESNGIFAEGYEVAVNIAATNESVGGSKRYIQEYYLPPQTEDLMLAYTIPPDVVGQLADSLGCLELNSDNYPENTVYGRGTDVNGAEISRGLGTAYSTIRFFGHTQGSTDVETQDFSFPIELCCGCVVNWSNCVSLCDRYCGSPVSIKSCNPAVLNGTERLDCRLLYNNPDATWQTSCDNPGSQQECDCGRCS